MKSFVVLALAAAALALPQSSSSSCSPDAAGTFQTTTVNLTKRDIGIRQASALALSLAGGNLKDSSGRIGYIAANNQFQFDNPVQNGALVTSGWALCSNGSLSLQGSTVFYQCLSGTFYNLYNKMIRPDCLAINIQAVTGSSTAQPTVSQKTDGQPQATSPGVVSQITDGQPQATKPGVVSQISDGQPQATKPGVVSQISDGQPQATKPAAASSKPAVVTQISDGQPQATKPGVVSQISDGQPQATKPAAASSKPAVVTQISDGQPQATKPAAASSVAVVSQISDGQPQATKPSVPTFSAAAAPNPQHVGAFAAGVFGLLALL